jgi:hypothetical protein
MGVNDNQREMMVLSVSSETPHCKGNESQDIVALLETVLMSTERETRLQEAKGFMKSTEIRSGTDREHERSQDVVRLKTSLGWGYV